MIDPQQEARCNRIWINKERGNAMERGSNENANKLYADSYPKGTDIGRSAGKQIKRLRRTPERCAFVGRKIKPQFRMHEFLHIFDLKNTETNAILFLDGIAAIIMDKEENTSADERKYSLF